MILNFDVLQAASNNRYVDTSDIRFVNLGPTPLFSNYKLATSSGKHLEEISHAHSVSLLYKLLTSNKDNNDLSIGFHRDRRRRKSELSNNKIIKGKYHIRICLKVIFGFAEYQEKGTYGLGYKLTLTRNTDNAVLNKSAATNIAKVKINILDWYVPHYSPNFEEYNKNNGSDLEKFSNTTSLSRKICLHEKGKYSKSLDFRIGHSRRY